MLAFHALRLHVSRCRARQAWIDRACETLSALDPNARLLNAAEALTSLAVVEHLRELLPDEHLACRFESVAEQDDAVAAFVDRFGAELVVTLHLGYAPVAFECRLKAALVGWREFCEASVDAYNACLYPHDMSWYLALAGRRFAYPMDCGVDERPRLAAEWMGR